MTSDTHMKYYKHLHTACVKLSGSKNVTILTMYENRSTTYINDLETHFILLFCWHKQPAPPPPPLSTIRSSRTANNLPSEHRHGRSTTDLFLVRRKVCPWSAAMFALTSLQLDNLLQGSPTFFFPRAKNSFRVRPKGQETLAVFLKTANFRRSQWPCGLRRGS
jgi:hypothetical protein